MLPIIAAISLGGALAVSPTAEASPRFTVVNDTKASIKVMIFNGGDATCDVYAKKNPSRRAKPGHMVAREMAKDSAKWCRERAVKISATIL